MRNDTCKICKKIFTRDWNLRRHVHDVHGIEVNTNPANSNLEDRKYSNNPKTNSNFLFNDDIQYNNNYNQNLNSLANFHQYFEIAYPSNESFPFLEWDAPIKEKETLTLVEKLKIQKLLKKLAIHLLKRRLPANYVHIFLNSLNLRCIREKSDEPLKRYLTFNMLGDLWE